jgi:4-hydroxy 2-oxovalerate aldolase
MSFQISDCTIRDGGYLTGKVFPDEFVHGVLEGLVNAGIDYVEVGFLQKQVNGEPIVYLDSKGVMKYLPKDKKGTEFVGFCDNSRYSIDLLDECDHQSFESLRISFAKHESAEALKFCAAAKQKGYRVFVQPMDAPGYTFEERAKMIEEVNKMQPETFSIVDTFGIMDMHELRGIFHQVDELLDKNIKVGLHSHNNLNLSCALVEDLISMAEKTDRSVVVDGALFGMGRGAGNANTEAIVHLLNKRYGKNYDLPLLLDVIEKYIVPLKSQVRWGYDMPMFVCGSQCSHVDNVYYIERTKKASVRDMYEVLGSLSVDKRKRYGTGYSKNDFSLLQESLDSYYKEKK